MTDPTTPVPGDPVQRELDTLKRLAMDVRRQQSVGRAWMYATTLVVIVLFAVFTWGTYAHIRRSFDQPSVQRAFDDHWKQMRPMAEQMLTATGQNVMPAYGEAIVATLKTRGPGAATVAVDKLKGVPAQAGQEFRDRLAAAFEAAVNRLKPDLKAAFPNLPDDRRQQILQAFVADQIAAQNKRIATRVDQLATNDLIHMQTVLEKFDLPKSTDPAATPSELERRFLHTMVALLDDHVDGAFATTAAESDDGPARLVGARLSPTTAAATPIGH